MASEIESTMTAVKQALRIEDGIDAYDAELRLLIRACEDDLEIAGVDNPRFHIPLFTQAAILYCKAYFGAGDERFEASYRMARDSFALSRSDAIRRHNKAIEAMRHGNKY